MKTQVCGQIDMWMNHVHKNHITSDVEIKHTVCGPYKTHPVVNNREDLDAFLLSYTNKDVCVCVCAMRGL